MSDKPRIINLIIKLICLMIILYISCSTKVVANELKQDTPLIDIKKMATLQIKYDNGENIPLSDVKFKIYRVASVSSEFYYTLVDNFKDYPVICNGLKTAEQWRDLATTLDGYASSDGIIPLIETNTDENGQIKINNLETGLYLLVGDSKELGITKYSCEPVLISLPNLSSKNTWDYEVKIKPKVEKFDDVSRLYKKTVTVVWDDIQYEYIRPTQIVAKLYKYVEGSDIGYELFEQVILNAENDWTYIFKNLDSKYKYKLVELPVKGYTTSIAEGIDFYTITNTYTDIVIDDNDEILPKTGQTWWIVPVFAISGILFFIIGYILNKKGKKEYEK